MADTARLTEAPAGALRSGWVSRTAQGCRRALLARQDFPRELRGLANLIVIPLV